MCVQMQGAEGVLTSAPPSKEPRLMLDLIRIFSFLADCSSTSLPVSALHPGVHRSHLPLLHFRYMKQRQLTAQLTQ